MARFATRSLIQPAKAGPRPEEHFRAWALNVHREICTVPRMAISNPALRVNPGGGLTPAEVVGRDAFVDDLWASLERQSVLLTAERRMGKTSVLSKMLAEPRAGSCTIKRSLQGIASVDEFVRALVADTEKAMPGLLTTSLGAKLRQTGVRKIGVSPLSVEFDPPSDRSWKDLATETFATLDRDVDSTVVLLWDELPHMVASIRDNHDPGIAREVLDFLRGLRETYSGARMVFSGSLGLHHVVHDLRAEGGMWVPTHDMLTIDVPPLLEEDASYLAGQLLRNEAVDCDHVDAVADVAAAEVDSVPYYVHHTVRDLMARQRAGRCGPADAALVAQVVEEALRDPLDPWQLQHYVDRIDVYYGDEAPVVKGMLDVIATVSTPPTAEALREHVGAILEPPSIERVRELLDLLCKDHYLRTGPGYEFRLNLIRRVWLARRPR